MQPYPLTIHVFGPLRVLVDAEPLPRMRTRSVEWLLALLVLRHGRTVDRSWLAGTLWPDSEESQALKNLRNDLMRLRQALGAESGRILSPTRDTLTFDLEGADVDVLRFDRAMQAGDAESLRSAVASYTGPLLEGCYEAWASAERETREQAYLEALETLAEEAEQREDYAEALSLLRRAEMMDSLRDSTQRRLMRVLAASGDVPAALLAYREHRLRLRREMNLEPDEETTRLYQEIRATGEGERRKAKGESNQGVRVFRYSGVREELPDERPTTNDERINPNTEYLNTQTPEHPNTQHPTPEYLKTLPHAITALIGREQAVREVRERVVASRLVTLVGAGGVGKTRLAMQVATDAAEDFEDKAAFVALAPLADPTLLPAFVAAALGIRENEAPEPAFLLQTLADWIGERSLLLVLDNCEHLIEAAVRLVQTLLERCPRLHILATSRQRLGLTGEIRWQVPSLPFPDPEDFRLPIADVGLPHSNEPIENSPLANQPAAIENQLMQYAAVQLFVERATMARADFSLTDPREAVAVAQICHRLDGIPLAIELAAARMGMLTAEQIAERLDDRFRILTGGSPAALPRHRTLRALIDWSYDLLDAPEQALLRRLSVFVGGWTLEAAEWVCGSDFEREMDATPTHPDAHASVLDTLDAIFPLAPRGLNQALYGDLPTSVLDILSALADKSLVLAEEHPSGLRYRMLETIREYAGAKLRASGEAEAVRSRYLAYFLNEARKVAPALRGPFPEDALPRLNAESANFSAAFTWAPPEAHLKLAATLWPYWEITGAFAEGRAQLSAARNRSGPTVSQEWAQALLGSATFAMIQFDWEEALRLGQESLDVFRALGDRCGAAQARFCMGQAARDWGDIAQALSLIREGLDDSRQCGWTHGSALGCWLLGLAAARGGDPDEARSLLEEGLSLAESVGDSPLVSDSLESLGHLALETGDYDRAAAMLDRVLALRRRLGHKHATMVTLMALARLARRQEDLTRARQYLEEVVALARAEGNRNYLTTSLHECGCIYYIQGAYVLAESAYSESLALFRQQNVQGIGYACNNLGSTLFHLGDLRRARELHREALGLYQKDENTEGIAWSLERLAVVEAREGDPHSAARLLGAASRLREALGKPMDSWDQADWDRAVSTVRTALGEAAFTERWSEGRA